MAQTALTLVGAAVGGYFFGPAGAQIGASLGAYVGGVVTAKDITGPRIADTAIQTSSYGAGIPKTYGTDRIAGIVIWAGPLVEHANEASGKGGPTVTTFSYTRSFAVLLGDGPIGSIRRIWADTKLVFDYRDVADATAQMASSTFAQYLTLYHGTEDQMPDPTIESIEGAGTVEAYRGRAYLVLTDFPLADYGNRIPQFNFEISNQPAVADTSTGYEPLVIFGWDVSDIPAHSVAPTLYTGASTTTSTGQAFAAIAEEQAAAYFDSTFLGHAGAANATTYLNAWISSTNATPSVFPGGASLVDNPQFIYAFVAAVDVDFSLGRYLYDHDVEDTFSWPQERYLWVEPEGTSPFVCIRFEYPDPFGTGTPPPPPSSDFVLFATGNVTPLDSHGRSSIVYGTPVLSIRCERVPTHRERSCYPGDPCAMLLTNPLA